MPSTINLSSLSDPQDDPLHMDTPLGRVAMLGRVRADLMSRAVALRLIESYASGLESGQLAVSSVNLDHIHHFGRDPRMAGCFISTSDANGGPCGIRWLNLVDGAPVAQQARRLSGEAVPKLSGSDLIGPILDIARRSGLRVGFLGGRPETHHRLQSGWSSAYPDITVAGWWAPEREELTHPERALHLTAEIAAAAVDILIVGLGKPRQEQWILENGIASAARVLLAFGAVVDFLAGEIPRAPAVAFRPRPRVGLAVRSRTKTSGSPLLDPGSPVLCAAPSEQPAGAVPREGASAPSRLVGSGRFVGVEERSAVTAVIVTFNNGDDLPGVLATSDFWLSRSPSV